MAKKKIDSSEIEETREVDDEELEVGGDGVDGLDDDGSDHEEEFGESDHDLILRLETEDREEAMKVFSFDEEIGFNPVFDWESLPEKAVDDAVSWFGTSVEELNAFKFGKNDAPYKKWIIALACKRNGLHDKFREITNGLLKTKKRDEKLQYEDICLELVDDYASTGEFADSYATLERAEKEFGLFKDVELRVRGLLLVQEGKTAEATDVFEQFVNRSTLADTPKGPKTADDYTHRHKLFDVALALASIQQFTLALKYFDDSKKLADLENDEALRVDIESWVDRIHKLTEEQYC